MGIEVSTSDGPTFEAVYGIYGPTVSRLRRAVPAFECLLLALFGPAVVT